MATLILILRILVVIFGTFVFTAILVMSKELWEDDKLFLSRLFLPMCLLLASRFP